MRRPAGSTTCEACGYPFQADAIWAAWLAWAVPKKHGGMRPARSPRWPRRHSTALLCPECGWRCVMWQDVSRGVSCP